ncbi:hypothetical protein ACFS07_17225 [Undibacterium arcticum]
MDREEIRGPVHWDIRLMESFMLIIGPRFRFCQSAMVRPGETTSSSKIASASRQSGK